MKSFQVFTENRPMVELLADRDAGKLIKALLAHADGEEPQELPKPVLMLYLVMAGQADRMEAAYQELRAKRSEAGRAGGVAKASKSGKAKQSQATNTNTNTNTTYSSRARKNNFFDFEQRTDKDLDEIIRKEIG